MITQTHINDIAFAIVGCAIEVHKHLGLGLLESVYKPCLVEEINQKGLAVISEISVPVSYKGKNFGGILKLDLLVEN